MQYTAQISGPVIDNCKHSSPLLILTNKNPARVREMSENQRAFRLKRSPHSDAAFGCVMMV